jgi:hypothetical protein
MKPFQVVNGQTKNMRGRHLDHADDSYGEEEKMEDKWDDDDDDDEEEEAIGLLSKRSLSQKKQTVMSETQGGGGDYKRNPFAATLSLLLMVVTVVGLIVDILRNKKTMRTAEDIAPWPSWACPKPLDASDEDVDVGKYIRQGDEYGLRDKNAAELWEWMQQADVDGWGRDYQEARARIHEFKVQEFAPHFKKKKKNKQEDTIIHIYESACGVGRNLAITLDIVREVNGGDISNNNTTVVVVHGNDYASDSAAAAQTVFGTLEPSGAKLGTICGGVDSTDLSHVPSNSFDIVYTGYVGLLHDPLDYSGTYPDRKTRKVYKELCKNASKDDDYTAAHDAQQQIQKMYQIQEDWYAKWVGEMIRIAKPGSPVMVEEVPVPKCDDYHDNGGVSQEFWLDTTDKKYKSWNQVDPTSIHFMQAHRGDTDTRYHVAMMKKKES